jgi:hypothetical protein
MHAGNPVNSDGASVCWGLVSETRPWTSLGVLLTTIRNPEEWTEVLLPQPEVQANEEILRI